MKNMLETPLAFAVYVYLDAIEEISAIQGEIFTLVWHTTDQDRRGFVCRGRGDIYLLVRF